MTQAPEQESPTTIFLHAKKAYDLMLSRATKQVDDEGKDIIVYEGMLTKLITSDLNLSTPYYSSIMKLLKNMRCVRQLRRGGGTAPSQWELITEPTEELFHTHVPPKPRKGGKWDMQQEQINNMNRRLTKLEQALYREATTDE